MKERHKAQGIRLKVFWAGINPAPCGKIMIAPALSLAPCALRLF
ncbi:MAG: hypothetical protein ABII06_00050 [Pseudomonadota bacterium]